MGTLKSSKPDLISEQFGKAELHFDNGFYSIKRVFWVEMDPDAGPNASKIIDPMRLCGVTVYDLHPDARMAKYNLRAMTVDDIAQSDTKYAITILYRQPTEPWVDGPWWMSIKHFGRWETKNRGIDNVPLVVKFQPPQVSDAEFAASPQWLNYNNRGAELPFYKPYRVYQFRRRLSSLLRSQIGAATWGTKFLGKMNTGVVGGALGTAASPGDPWMISPTGVVTYDPKKSFLQGCLLCTAMEESTRDAGASWDYHVELTWKDDGWDPWGQFKTGLNEIPAGGLFTDAADKSLLGPDHEGTVAKKPYVYIRPRFYNTVDFFAPATAGGLGIGEAGPGQPSDIIL